MGDERMRVWSEARRDDAVAAEAEAGFPSLARGRAAAESHPIEAVGARLRSMMPWLDD